MPREDRTMRPGSPEEEQSGPETPPPAQEEQEELETDEELSQDIELDARRKRVKVVIRDENDSLRTYHLVELLGEDRDKYMNAMASRARFDSQGNPIHMRDFKGVQAELISRCLRYEDDKVVPVAIIQKWPARIQMILYERAAKMSGMDKMAMERAKNV